MILELEKVLRKTYLGLHESEFKKGFYHALKLVWTCMNKYPDMVNIHIENKKLKLELDEYTHWKAQAIKREDNHILYNKSLADALKNRNIQISELQVEIKAKNKEINLLQQAKRHIKQ